MKLILSVLTAMLLSGCAMLQQSPTTAHLAVTVATMKVVEAGDNPVERAQRVIAVANEAKRLIDNEAVTIDVLEEAIKNRLDQEPLAPSDRLLADALIITIADELRARVGMGLLDEQQRLTVSTVLGWVVRAAGG